MSCSLSAVIAASTFNFRYQSSVLFILVTSKDLVTQGNRFRREKEPDQMEFNHGKARQSIYRLMKQLPLKRARGINFHNFGPRHRFTQSKSRVAAKRDRKPDNY